MFLGIKCSINQAMNDIWTNPFCKSLQNIDRNETGKFGLYVSATEVEISGSESEKKTHFEKTGL